MLTSTDQPAQSADQTPGSISPGQRLVRRNFNPSASPTVEEVKQNFADMADRVEQFYVHFVLSQRDKLDRDEVERLKNRTLDAIEEASMFYVKMVTT